MRCTMPARCGCPMEGAERLLDHAYRRFRDLRGPDAPLPGTFVTAAELSPEAHLQMQALVQEHTDAAVSKHQFVRRNCFCGASRALRSGL